MNLKPLFPTVAAALVLAVAGCNKSGKLSEQSTFKPPTGPVELKLKWTPGESIVQDMDMKSKTEINVPGQPQPMHQDMTMGQKYALTVLKETPDGGHELELEFLSARMSMQMAGKSVLNYDSSKSAGSDKTNPVASMFGKIVGSKIKFVMDASNNVSEVEGADELMNRLAAGGSPAAVAPLKSLFSEGYFKQLMSSSRFMPPNAVSPGDSWPVQMEIPMAMFGTLVLDYTITFQGWEKHGARECARLEFDGTIKTKPGDSPGLMGMTMAIKDSNTSGVSWFDPELGITIESDMKQDLTMLMTIPKNPKVKQGMGSEPQTITAQMSQMINIKLDSVK